MTKCLLTGKIASVAGCQCEVCKKKRDYDTEQQRLRRLDPEFRKSEALNAQRYRQKHPEYRKRMGERSSKYHDELVELLGGPKCVCLQVGCWHQGNCMVSDSRVAHVEHKSGGGVKEIREVFGSSQSMYKYYLKHQEEAKQKLQVYCSNCNWVKRHSNTNETGGAPKTRDWENSKF